MTATISRGKSEVLASARAVLARRAGTSMTLLDAEDLGGGGRSLVLRVKIPENPLSEARSVVVKAFPADGDRQAFLREVASYKYATSLPVASRPGPQLLAADVTDGLLVLSDLGHGKAMTDWLGGADFDDTQRAVSAWGQALGRMHAATFGGEDDFCALLRQGVKDPAPDMLERLARESLDGLGPAFGLLGIDVPEQLRDEVTAALRLFAEGDFRAFSPADVGPENILLNDDGVQFMDYEWGAFRDATLDVGYALVTFPRELSPDLRSRRRELEISLVDAWRSEVQPYWSAIGSDRKAARRLLRARVLWVWLGTYWVLAGMPDMARDHDWALQTGDVRQILDRWRQVADAAEGTGETAGAAAARTIEQALRRYWFE